MACHPRIQRPSFASHSEYRHSRAPCDKCFCRLVKMVQAMSWYIKSPVRRHETNQLSKTPDAVDTQDRSRKCAYLERPVLAAWCLVPTVALWESFATYHNIPWLVGAPEVQTRSHLEKTEQMMSCPAILERIELPGDIAAIIQ